MMIEGENDSTQSKEMKTKTNNNLLLNKAREAISRRMLVSGVLLISGLMLLNVASMSNFNVSGLVLTFIPTTHSPLFAANSGSSTLNVNIAGGALELLNVPATHKFADGTAGSASTVYNEMDLVVVRDYRETPASWNLRAYSTEMNNGGASSIPNGNIAAYVESAVRNNLGTDWNPTSVGNGDGDNSLLSSNIVLFNGVTSSAGAMVFNDINWRIYMNETLPADEYEGTLTIVVI